MGTVDRWYVYTRIDHQNDGVVDDYMLLVARVVMMVVMLVVAIVVMMMVMLMVGRGVDQTYGSQVCLRSAIVGTVQVVHPGVP